MEKRKGRHAKGGDKRKQTVLGLAALALPALFACGWLWLRQPGAPARNPAQTLSAAGFVSLPKAMRAHPAYASLAALREERDGLLAALRAEEGKLLWMTAPRAIRAPFEDAAEQKTKRETGEKRRAQLSALEEAEKRKREETRASFEAARDEINAAYFNEIFNTRLKIDNADLMRLPEEAVADLKRHLETLQRERGRHQYELWRRYEAEIRAYKESLAEAQGIELAALEASAEERLRAGEIQKQSEAQARNLDLLQQNLLDASEARVRIQETQAALRAKEQELAALEAGIAGELAGKAAKLAVMHRLSVVYASGGPPAAQGAPPVRAVAGTAVDLTEALVRELAHGGT